MLGFYNPDGLPDLVMHWTNALESCLPYIVTFAIILRMAWSKITERLDTHEAELNGGLDKRIEATARRVVNESSSNPPAPGGGGNNGPVNSNRAIPKPLA